jgi:hypothetical protein
MGHFAALRAALLVGTAARTAGWSMLLPYANGTSPARRSGHSLLVWNDSSPCGEGAAPTHKGDDDPELPSGP